ncbi:MAG: VWA domain-containing protein [Myxococcota bacterium]
MNKSPSRSVQVVEHDGFDRESFDRVRSRSPALQDGIDRLERILPHGEALVFDVFAALFKLNVRILPKAEVEASSLMNRRIVRSVFEDPEMETLRAHSALDAGRAMEAVSLLSHRIADALTAKDRLVASELMTGMETSQDEESQAFLERQRERLQDAPWPEELKKGLKAELDAEQRKLRSKTKAQRQALDQSAEQLPVGFDHEVSGALADLNQGMVDVEDAMRAFGLGGGRTGAGGDAALRMELGRRLAKQQKLRLLARLLGAFKEVAFEARRKKLSFSPQTLHDVAMGAELENLLPAELLGLRPGPLHREFLRRYAEGELLRYELKGPKSKGPMIVCVDGSGSMSGSKEIWAKAVALTFVEIARRQKRRCLGVVFSGGPDLFETELAAPRASSIEPSALFAFTDHFPGGGTSFTEPLDLALSRLTEKPYRRGDVLFITDGEAPVSADLVARIQQAQRRQGFKIRSIAIGDARTESLQRFSDEVRSVTDLTGDALTDLFQRVD